MGRLFRTACLVLGFSFVALLHVSQANAGSFKVMDCESGYPGLGVMQAIESPASINLNHLQNCPSGDEQLSVGAGSNMHQDDLGMLRYTTTPGSAITGVTFEYYKATGNKANTHYYLNNSGGANTVEVPGLIPNTTAGMANWYYLPAGQRRTTFRGVLKCEAATCGSGSYFQMVKLSQVELQIEDFQAPSIVQQSGGNLTAPGTVSGTRTFQTLAYDEESGITQVAIIINNQLAQWRANGNCVATSRWVPCGSMVEDFNVNTTQAPVVEGLNSIYICANDYAQTGSVNTTCSPRQYFTVNN